MLSRKIFSYRYCYILMLDSFLILLQITQRFLVRHTQNSLGLEKFHETEPAGEEIESPGFRKSGFVGNCWRV